MRTKFQRDRDRILHSNSFRRLKHKTQVYIAPEGDHYRTRMTHTLEVAQIGRTMARALRLNEDLVEAIAMGHDLGHTPFGHVGEQALRDVCGHFEHNEQSVRIVECLENDGRGLNLTEEVKDGMLNHSGNLKAHTLEGGLIKYADRIAYLCHDYDDAENMGLISAKELPDRVRRVLGTTHSSMITAMVQNLVENSMDEDTIHMDKEGDEVLLEFRSFMFDRVYMSQPLIPDRKRGHGVVVMLYEWYMSHPDELPEKQKNWRREISPWLPEITSAGLPIILPSTCSKRNICPSIGTCKSKSREERKRKILMAFPVIDTAAVYFISCFQK